MERIIIDNVSKKFKIGFKKEQTALSRIISFFSGGESKKIIYALRNVSFSVKKGEILGIIGDNGSGKSTLLRIIARIYEVDKGYIKTNGNVVPLIDLGGRLHARLTMKDNIFFIGSLFGLSQKTIKKKFNSIVKLSGLQNFINTKLYKFSSGMIARLAFSIVIHCNPDILLLDEVFAVGDKDFRFKSSKKIKEFAKNGTSIIFVSHDLESVKKYCDRVILMEKGKIIGVGNPEKIIRKYKKKL